MNGRDDFYFLTIKCVTSLKLIKSHLGNCYSRMKSFAKIDNDSKSTFIVETNVSINKSKHTVVHKCVNTNGVDIFLAVTSFPVHRMRKDFKSMQNSTMTLQMIHNVFPLRITKPVALKNLFHISNVCCWDVKENMFFLFQFVLD